MPGALESVNLYGAAVDEILAVDDGSDVQWSLADHEGSVRDIVDNSGALIEHRDYSAYGEMSRFNADGTPDTVALDFIFAFTGREWDDDIHLANHRARWYDPHAARFINQDPSGFAGGDANLYRYAGNNPVIFVDPSGLCYEKFADGVPNTSIPGIGAVGIMISLASRLATNLVNGTIDVTGQVLGPTGWRKPVASDYGGQSEYYAAWQNPLFMHADGRIRKEHRDEFNSGVPLMRIRDRNAETRRWFKLQDYFIWARIESVLLNNTQFRVGASTVHKLDSGFVVGGRESLGYFNRATSHHEMMHLGQYIRNPNIIDTNPIGLIHEVIPSFVGTPELYGAGVTTIVGRGYLINDALSD